MIINVLHGLMVGYAYLKYNVSLLLFFLYSKTQNNYDLFETS